MEEQDGFDAFVADVVEGECSRCGWVRRSANASRTTGADWRGSALSFCDRKRAVPAALSRWVMGADRLVW